MNKYTILALREITTEMINPQPGMEPVNFEFLISPRPTRLYSQMGLEDLHETDWSDSLRKEVDDSIEEACKIILKAMFEDCTKEIE